MDFLRSTAFDVDRYIGPPKEALATIRQALGHAELDKPRPDSADP